MPAVTTDLLNKMALERDFIFDDPLNHELSEKIIRPLSEDLFHWFFELRKIIDREYLRKLEKKVKSSRVNQNEKSLGDIDIDKYPVGFCEKIRDAILRILDNELHKDPRHPLAQVLWDFQSKGGIIKGIWGEVPTGPYFQNAIQIGEYYYDPSNDTVDITKPKVEFAHFEKMNFRNVEDFDRLFEVHKSYLNRTLFPNAYFPLISYAAPILSLDERGKLRLPVTPSGISARNILSSFEMGEKAMKSPSLTASKLPGLVLESLEQRLSNFKHPLFSLFKKDGDLSGFSKVRDQAEKSGDSLGFYARHVSEVSTCYLEVEKQSIVIEPEQLGRLRDQGLLPATVKKASSL